MRLFYTIMCLFTLSACQTNSLTYVPAGEMTVENNGETYKTVSQGTHYSGLSGQPLNLGDYDFFTQSDFAKKWLKQPGHKALAVGFPQVCAAYNGRWRHGKLSQAIEMTMKDCLRSVQAKARMFGRECGCRLVAADNKIFLSPEELPYRRSQPAIVQVEGKTGKKEILGYIVTSGVVGKRQALEFYSEQDRLVCHGTYNLGQRSSSGEAEISCFDGRMKGLGSFNVAGFRGGRAYGTATIKTGTDDLRLVYGIKDEEYVRRKRKTLGK